MRAKNSHAWAPLTKLGANNHYRIFLNDVARPTGLPIIPFAYPTIVLVEKRREEARLAGRSFFSGSNSSADASAHYRSESAADPTLHGCPSLQGSSCAEGPFLYGLSSTGDIYRTGKQYSLMQHLINT
jgi:hypothetical protein